MLTLGILCKALHSAPLVPEISIIVTTKDQATGYEPKVVHDIYMRELHKTFPTSLKEFTNGILTNDTSPTMTKSYPSPIMAASESVHG